LTTKENLKLENSSIKFVARLHIRLAAMRKARADHSHHMLIDRRRFAISDNAYILDTGYEMDGTLWTLRYRKVTLSAWEDRQNIACQQ
jgi:hypothetical protein